MNDTVFVSGFSDGAKKTADFVSRPGIEIQAELSAMEKVVN